LAALAVWVAFSTFSIGLAAFSLVAALGLCIAGTLNLVSARLSKQSQSPARMMDAEALAKVRKRANEKDGGGPATASASSDSGKRVPDSEGGMDGGADGGAGGGD